MLDFYLNDVNFFIDKFFKKQLNLQFSYSEHVIENMAKLIWESIENDELGDRMFGTQTIFTKRAKVPGGWLVCMIGGRAGGITFYPDPNHQWDGNSLS